MLFCNDSDLLHWEPDILDDAAFVSQHLTSGTGNLEGSAFVAAATPAFQDGTGVEPGNVLILGSPINGCFPIVEKLTDTFLRISTLTSELFPESGADPTPMGTMSATDVSYTVRSFWAQRSIVSEFLLQAAGGDPSIARSRGLVEPAVLNPASLRRACALGTLQMIFATLASVAEEPARYTARAEMYERLYRRALRQTHVELDLDGDGRADLRKSLGVMQMTRA